MELLHYYHIIRQRAWIMILGVSAALAIVIVYQLLPPGSRQAKGRLRVNEAGQRALVYQGGELRAGAQRDFWRTFETLIQSRTVTENAAARLGLTGPEILAQLSLEAAQPSPGDVLDITGTGPDEEVATAFTQGALEYVGELRNRQRMADARQIRNILETLREQRAADLAKRQDALEALRSGGLSPDQELSRVAGDLAVTRSQIESTKQDVAVAERQVQAAEELSAGMAPALFALQPRAADVRTGQLEQEAATLRSRLAAELTQRTDDHPQVHQLRAQIAALDEMLEASKRESEEAEEDVEEPPRPQVVDARLTLEETRARLALLQQHADEVQRSLPPLRVAAEQFETTRNSVEKARTIVSRIDDQSTTVGAEIARLAAQLENVEEPSGGGAEAGETDIARDVEIVDEAQPLPSPKTLPKFFLLAAAALLGGAVLMIVVILSFHYTSVSFANDVEARMMLRIEVIGAIPRSDLPADKAGSPLRVR